MSYLDDATAATGGWEGRIPWLYRDTVGRVTVGCGKMLPNLVEAMTLHETHPFQCAGQTASVEQIGTDWARLWTLPFGQEYGAGSYKARTSVSLLDADITALLREVLTGCDVALRAEFPGYDSLPDPVKMALLDMDYNLGDAKLRTTYPRFDAAVDAKDWLVAAAQCNRLGIGNERNAWTKAQFMLALGNPAGIE